MPAEVSRPGGGGGGRAVIYTRAVRPLTARLGAEPLVGDGGMGSLLSAMLPRARCPEEANLIAPEAVVSLHLGFIRAGADIVQANTYGANRPKLANHRLDDRVEEIVRAGVKLAREAREVAGRDVLVAGSIGPLGPARSQLSAAQIRALYAEQALLLESRGIDLFVLETFTALDELSIALAAVRETADLPLIAQVTVGDESETLTGGSAGAAADLLADERVVAAGVNCSLGPQSVLAAVEAMRARTEMPLTAQPNAGLPSLSAGRVIYPNA
jgi:methionine synthase / methylenetetrahydrofolate reductase(NADPH)